MQQGSTTVTYYANDTSNNLNDSETVTFFIDSINPDINFSAGTPLDNTNQSNNYIFVNVSVTETNEDTITFLIYNSTGQYNSTSFTNDTRNINFTGLADDVYTFNVTVNDTLGNTNTTSTRSVTIDTIIPAVNLIGPQNITYTRTNLEINFTAIDTNLETCLYTDDDGTTNNTLTNCNNATYTASEGSTTIILYINDSANNFNNSEKVTFFVDSINPDVNFSEGTPLDNTNQTLDHFFINVSVTETNEDTIVFLIHNLTGQFNRSSFTNATRNINLTSVPDGTYIYNVTVNDTLGNSNVTETRTLIIDNEAPVVASLTETPSDPAIYSLNGVYEFNATITDSLIDVDSVFLEFDGTNFTPSINGNVRNVSISDLGVGTFSYRWFANDTLGNTNSSENATYTVDKAGGEVNTYINGTRANFSTINGSANQNIYLNVSLINGTGNIQLFLNGSSQNVGSSPLFNVSNLSIGFYNITGNYSGDENFTSAIEVWWVNITALDIIPPDLNFESPTPFSGDLVYEDILVNISFSGADNATIYLFNSSKDIINTTTSITSPLFLNYTNLNSGVYFFNASAIDSANNVNTTKLRNILLINPSLVGDGTVNNSYKINESRFGNGDELNGDFFGRSVANIGDLNGDGVQDIAVGEDGNDDGGAGNGAVWILFLNTSGGVKSEYKINESRFGNGAELGGDGLGSSVAGLGDLNGDGVQDIAVGEWNNDDGGAQNGAVWILFLNTSGGVNNSYKINESRFGNGDEFDGENFGSSITNLGDLNNDGVQDIAVGEFNHNSGNGAVWILFLNTSGGVKSEYEINETRFGNENELNFGSFGVSVANLGDLDGDGIIDIGIGATIEGDGGEVYVWVNTINKKCNCLTIIKIIRCIICIIGNCC